MSVKSRITKTTVKLLCLALFANLMMGSVCFAEDEDEGEGLPKKSYSLGMERPKPAPKVIIREKIVVQCPPGSSWNADVKRCQNEDGEDIAPAPKAKKKPQPRVAEEDSEPAPRPAPKKQAAVQQDDRYAYPNSKLRFKLLKCSMKGETVTCNANVTNTLEGTAAISFGNITITDGNGKTYKKKSHSQPSYGSDRASYPLNYGNSLEFGFNFPLVDPSATTLTFSGSINANSGADALVFENITILK